MPLSRRAFLELLGGSTAYAFTFSCTGGSDGPAPAPTPRPVTGDHALRYFVDYTEWLFIHADSSVTVHTGRIDMGQGLKTVLSNLVSQGLQIAPEKVTIVLGDTDRCPDDGPTEGSSATRIVGWGYWRACERVRGHLVERAAEALGVSVRRLEYHDGAVVGTKDPDLRLAIGELADGSLHLDTIDPTERWESATTYVDRGTGNVNAEAVVTGTLVFTGDLFAGECPYGSLALPEHHIHFSKIESADLEAAARTPGVDHVARLGKTAFAVGSGFRAVQNGLENLAPVWKVPTEPQEMDVEGWIRERATPVKTIEESGRAEDVLAAAEIRLGETYITQYATQAPIETETSVAEVGDDGVTVWASTQAPFKARKAVADRLKIDEEKVRVIAMPVGGGFGVKVNTLAPAEAALMARAAGRRVKHVYTRPYQVIGRGRYKEAVVADITSAVTADGSLVARTLDLYQDEGFGSTGTYDIPHVRSRLLHSKMPARHGTMRGTSFVQTCFAVESHTDMVAAEIGMDPVDFRKKNVAYASFRPLLDACAERIGYGARELPENHGIGFGICHHGGRQLGATAAEVSVNRRTGEVRVERMVGALDIGLVINRNTVRATVTGAMIWGLGFALFEEVHLDGHRTATRSMADYRIPRFSDIPPIDLIFLSNEVKIPRPRGCGELQVIPTIGAIANAVHQAVGVRFHTLPLTPERVLAALGS
ncbi:MAG: molybdopterin cofactor-binding domain-containing protein [Thermoanaerobaculales bacterium]|nr:molybdopterin cofactor-binding domain-containing protein [Thermoanaerobaculales bacterium]